MNFHRIRYEMLRSQQFLWHRFWQFCQHPKHSQNHPSDSLSRRYLVKYLEYHHPNHCKPFNSVGHWKFIASALTFQSQNAGGFQAELDEPAKVLNQMLFMMKKYWFIISLIPNYAISINFSNPSPISDKELALKVGGQTLKKVRVFNWNFKQ